MPLPLIGGGIKWCFCLTSVWHLTSVAYIGPKSRTERRMKTKFGTEVAHVTHDSDVTFRVKRSRSPGRFTHCGIYAHAAAVVSVGTYWAWETAATLPSAGSAARGAMAPTGGGEGRGHIVSPRAQLVMSDTVQFQLMHVCNVCLQSQLLLTMYKGATRNLCKKVRCVTSFVYVIVWTCAQSYTYSQFLFI